MILNNKLLIAIFILIIVFIVYSAILKNDRFKYKKSIFAKIRNNFIAGIVVLIPIGITLYLTLFLIRISGKIIPKK